MKDILIVEDEAEERCRLHDLFVQAGFSVTATESVLKAEKELGLETFRLAFIDIGLSDKSGSHLFNAIKKGGRVSYIIILTGNPSVHLKQRFIDDGAVDYLVKGSPQAQPDRLLLRVAELIGSATKASVPGLNLADFIDRFVSDKSKQLFLNSDGSFPECQQCRARDYLVTFSHKPQIPPKVEGMVVCAACGTPMDPEVS